MLDLGCMLIPVQDWCKTSANKAATRCTGYQALRMQFLTPNHKCWVVAKQYMEALDTIGP